MGKDLNSTVKIKKKDTENELDRCRELKKSTKN